jgi:hypothetical protein
VVRVISREDEAVSEDQGRDQRLTDEELDEVVGGNEAPGLVVVDPGTGATLYNVQPGDYPPPLVVVDGSAVNR